MTFPAYTNSGEAKEEALPKIESEIDADWLSCSSFNPLGTEIIFSTTKENVNKERRHKNKRRKRSRNEQTQSYCIDENPIPQVKCTIPTNLSKGKSDASIPKPKKKKKKHKALKAKRYFTDELQVETPHKIDPEEYTRLTKEFNILLREQPNDVDSWCKYIQLQDKGEGTKNGIASKKLSIVDKALEHNSSSEVLLTTKLALMEEIMPYDKVVSEAKILASKHVSSTVGWRWLITSTQFNLTRLTAPGLISHFGAMLEDATKRGGQPKFILDVLMEVGIFLRHAGLWELLWTLIEQYLEICFTVIGSGAFKYSVTLPEQEIEKLEDGIMTSGLPLHALWMRTEHLRACVHFLPTTEETGDHQRIVLPEDVAPLLYPISSELSTRLSSVALTLLKVPPLPCSEAFVSFLGLNNVPWHLESSEILLTAMLPSGVVHANDTYLNDLKELLVPPQFVKKNLGCEPFFEAVDKMFELIAQHCICDRINFLVWKIRWYRYCVKTKSLEGPSAKPLLTSAKAILKKERTALPIYTEYALLEDCAGNTAVALKVLETAINLQEPGLLASRREQPFIFAAYRAYVEVLLKNQPNGYQEAIFKMLISMAFGEKLENVKAVNTDLIHKALERFDHVSAEMITSIEAEDQATLEDVITGPANLHWLACYAWFNFVHRGQLPQCLSNVHFSKAPILSEGLAQLKIDVLGRMKESGTSGFDHKSYIDLITEACSRYPNNTSFLHALSSIKCDGIRWSKISSSLVQTGSPIAVMFFALLSKNRLFSGDSNHTGAVTKMYSLLTKCTESKHLERCPMLRRLILQYVSCTLDETVVEKEYHKAVEKCPWVKILYYEAANQLPKLLADIQDLLTEKELRIHVTPEELEILREPAPPEGPELADVGDTVSTVVEKEEIDSAAQTVVSDNAAQRMESSVVRAETGSRESSTDVEESSDSDDDIDSSASIPDSSPECIGHDVERGEVASRYGEPQTQITAPVMTPVVPAAVNPIVANTHVYPIIPAPVPPPSPSVYSAIVQGRGPTAHQFRMQDDDQAVDVEDAPTKKSRWDDSIGNTASQDSNTDHLPGSEMGSEESKWDEERKKIAKRLWDAKQRAKRQLEEMSSGDANALPQDGGDGKERILNDMNKLEQVQRAKMAPDSCADDTSQVEYNDSKWNAERLKSMRELWEAKRKK